MRTRSHGPPTADVTAQVHAQASSSFLTPSAAGFVSARSKNRQVRAIRDIEAGSLIAAFGGTVVFARSPSELAALCVGRLALQVDESLYLVSDRDGPADWINHSCDPNALLRGTLCLYAARDIVVGEAITYDYATSDGEAYDEFDCACGAPGCRRRIRGEDWRRPELRARYGDAFSPYLLRRMREESAALDTSKTRAVRASPERTDA